MSLYLDTSCLLKLFVPEAESLRTRLILAREEEIVISSLGRLETLVALQRLCAEHLLTPGDAMGIEKELKQMLLAAPLQFARMPD